jgi:tRNA threonylcarbamoyladenosine biosynthesis protein TsaB
LHRQGYLVACNTLAIPHSHAESLLPMITHTIAIGRCTTRELQAIAVSEGPGSYTGLRIGATTATGLAYAMDIPLIAINTLEAMIVQVAPFHLFSALYCPMIDARRMEVYCMVADRANTIYQPISAQIVTENSFAEFLADNLVFFFGDGAAKCKAILSNHTHARFIEGIYPSALHMGGLAYEKFQQGKFVDVTTFEPLYIKKPLSSS